MEYGKELKEYLSIQQTAHEIGFSREGVRKLIIKGELSPVYRVDKYILIPVSTIEEFKKKRKMENITDGRYKIK